MLKYKHIIIGYKCQDSKGNKGVVIDEYGHKCSVKFEDGTVRVKIPKSKIDSCSFRKELPEKLAKINIPLGTKYGNLSVVGYDGARLVVDCMCGNRVTKTRTSVMKLGKISCGCLATEISETKFWEGFDYWMSSWNPNTHKTDTKKIPLFKYRKGSTEIIGISGFSYVDADFYDHWKHLPFVMTTAEYAWLAKNKYVKRRICKSVSYINDFPRYALHHLVKGFKSNDIYVVDHINGLSLDNRHRNLRVATVQQNNFNSKSGCKNKTSKYKGVTFRGNRKMCWGASINVGTLKINKSFYTELEAALFYDEMAKLHHGEFALTNF